MITDLIKLRNVCFTLLLDTRIVRDGDNLDNHRASVHYLEIMDEAKLSLLFKQWTLARLIICLKSHLGQVTSNNAVWCPLRAKNTTLIDLTKELDLDVI